MPRFAYELQHPKRLTSCVVLASPHSGRDYSAAFVGKTCLDITTLRSSEDAFVDELFEAAPLFGAPFIRAGAPRAYVDYNRAETELDPSLIEGIRGVRLNPRISAGLGVVPRVVAHGRHIYQGKISRADADYRINTYWRPYHGALNSLLTTARARFGQAILIDCHSMPRESLDCCAGQNAHRPEIVLGDRFGAAASAGIVDAIEQAFAAAGFVVARNNPFAGAYSIQRYGNPRDHIHAVQVEIDRSLYMDERRVERIAQFEDIRRRLTAVIADIARIGGARRLPLAAE